MDEEASPLFDLDPAWRRRPPGREARRSQTQRALIRLGIHPLTVSIRAILRLHPDATRDPGDRLAAGPRCGSCRHLEPLEPGRSIFKCWIRNGNNMATRVTRGHGSDIRRWFPGCVDYSQGGGRGQTENQR